MNYIRSMIGLSLALMLSACGLLDKKESQENRGPLTFSERLNERNGYKQDQYGNWVPLNDKRSSFENQGQSAYFTERKDTDRFGTKGYETKAWGREKGFETGAYESKADGSRFVEGSRFTGKSARESSRVEGFSDTYKTQSYRTTAAGETKVGGIEKAYDYQTQKRRDVYIPPEVIDYKQQREMSVDQSKGILGRLRD